MIKRLSSFALASVLFVPTAFGQCGGTTAPPATANVPRPPVTQQAQRPQGTRSYSYEPTVGGFGTYNTNFPSFRGRQAIGGASGQFQGQRQLLTRP